MQAKLLLKHLLNRIEEAGHVQIFPRDRILSAISTDGGFTWTREPGIRIDVKGKHRSEMVYYPYVLPVKDGFRMYFYGSLKTGCGWRGRILSAWSDDGLRWEIENGVRVNYGASYDQCTAKAPCVILLNGTYRMYYAGSTDGRTFCILSAWSRDGVSWTKEPGIRLMAQQLPRISSVSDPHVIQWDSGWRMYFSGVSQDGERIYSAFSADGITWAPEKGIRIDIGQNGMQRIVNNPYILRKDHHTLRMYFRGSADGPIGSCIYSALSEYGLQWTIEPDIRLDFQGRYEQHGVEFPCILPLSTRKLRMYYTGFYGQYLLHPFTSPSPT